MSADEGYNSGVDGTQYVRGVTAGRPLMGWHLTMARTWLKRAAAAALIMVVTAAGATACPNCKEAVTLEAGEVANMSSGYNWSVCFMLVVPFSMLGTGVFLVRRAVKSGALPEM